MSNLWWKVIRKYQTALPQFFPELDETTGWEGWKPVQQVSAQPLEFKDKYLQGDYPEEFWSIVGNNPDDTKGHGSSRHRVDKYGNYAMVGVRGDSPVGDLPKRGPYRPRKGKENYPQDYGVRVTQKKDMPSRRNIVVKPMKADPNQTPNTDLKSISAKDKENRSKRKAKIFKPQVGRGGFRRGGKGIKVKKEAKSPAAIEHKRKYETQYESSPARKKYRRELERERRKRGVAGKGGKDMSHTKTGKIVPEDPHSNRARSHPSVGSTLKMVVVKAPQMNLSGQSAECEICGAIMNGQEVSVSNQQMGVSVCTACLLQEQQEINQARDDAMMYHGEPMDIAMQLLKDFNTCYQCGQTWEQLGLANATPFQRSLHEDRCMGMQTSEKDAMFQ